MRLRWALIGLLGAIALTGALQGSAAAGARSGRARVVGVPARYRVDIASGLHVIPFPGTPDASPQSPVIFSSLRPSELRSVRVTGSRSGVHAGRAQALPAGAGTAFVPGRRFAPGERVRVSAGLSSPAAGTASGAPGATRIHFGFGVGMLPTSAARSVIRSSSHRRATDAIPTKSFRSQPGLDPPVVRVTHNSDPGSGDIFLTPISNQTAGPMILNRKGQLVWFDPIFPNNAYNLTVQSYQGQPVLTWWQGGEVNVILNRAYQPVATVYPADGGSPDAHDFQITPRGTAFLFAGFPVKANLSKVGGSSNGSMWDIVVQEIDIATGKLVWDWHSYGHIPLSDSHQPPSKNATWGAFHLNSIQPLPGGKLLISSRNTWAVYEVSIKTGKILWTLGGRHSSFKMGPHTRFEWQHDARLHGNTLTLFDDAASPQEAPQSSGEKLHLNFRTRTATLIRRYPHTPPLLAGAQGGMQTLANRDVFVGWGVEPDFSEYTPDGKQIFTGSFALGVTSYRAYRLPWGGRPATPPAIAAAKSSGGRTNVWASWNGATDVAAWRVLGGPASVGLNTLATAAQHSFETEVTLGSQPQYLEVQALGARGNVLGTSTVHKLG